MHHAGLGFHTPGRNKAPPRSASGFGLTSNPLRKLPPPTPMPMRVHSDDEADRRPVPDGRRRKDAAGPVSNMQPLYDEMQVIWAKSLASLRVRTELEDGATETSSVPCGTWLQLVYPMREVQNAVTQRVFMRSRSVDPETGQLSLTWACVHETDKETGSTTRHVGDFTVFPASS